MIPAETPVTVTLTASEVEWLEQAARFGAAEPLYPPAAERLDALAAKLRAALREAA